MVTCTSRDVTSYFIERITPNYSVDLKTLLHIVVLYVVANSRAHEDEKRR